MNNFPEIHYRPKELSESDNLFLEQYNRWIKRTAKELAKSDDPWNMPLPEFEEVKIA